MESGDPSRPCKHPVPENYSSSGIGAIPLLDHVLRPLIEEEGPLPFPRFMELALYHGEHGYYSNPACTCGTLQTYARHRAGDDPLDAPGQRDLTTHLDFTSVREAAAAAGLQSLGSARQESYLVHLAHDLLHDLSPEERNRDFLRQFQTLTHPAFFGSRFHVLEFSKGATSSGLSFPCPA